MVINDALKISSNRRTISISGALLEQLGNPTRIRFTKSKDKWYLIPGPHEESVSIVQVQAGRRGMAFSRGIARELPSGIEISAEIKTSTQGVLVAIINDKQETWDDVLEQDSGPEDELYHGRGGIGLPELKTLFRVPTYNALEQELSKSQYGIDETTLKIRFDGPENTLSMRGFSAQWVSYWFTKGEWRQLLQIVHRSTKPDIKEIAAQFGLNYFSARVAVEDAKVFPKSSA